MEDVYSIKLPAFEGPLDLLLHLIRENKIDIYDIPIALITHQYLQYIGMMKELNLDIAGEFLLMAATLIHIKSRMLLPVDEEVEKEAEEDPRFELVQRLLEYQAFKDATFTFREREEVWSDVFFRSPSVGEVQGKETSSEDGLFAEGLDHGKEPHLFMTGEPELEGLNLFELSIVDLLTAFKKLLDKAPPETVSITRETLTVKDRISSIIERLDNQKAVRFEDLLDGRLTRSFLIVTFIAILELVRLGLARAYQERDFGNVWIIRRREASDEA
ncbi:MAG TPA: segregation/condensation protein A [Thermodesulfovibrionales bacterium]|nr:segregation/condensation protein A [Thermodesulfovibrionales bacterium]